MLIRFRSKASADVLMTEAAATRVFEALGRPLEPQGLLDVPELDALIARLQQAVADDDAHWKTLEAQAAAEGRRVRRPEVSLRQRVWPLQEMLRRGRAAGHPVLWGV